MLHMAQRRSVLGVLALVVLLAACGGGTSSSLAASTSTSPVTGTMKPLITGLIDMGSIMFNHNYAAPVDNSLTAIEGYPGSFRGKAINVLWSQLQPTPQSFDTSAIDQALSAITAYNQSHTTAPLLAKLRVWGGGHAPDWVKQIGGPITVIDRPTSNAPVTVTVGAFWSAQYDQAWQKLQTMLAARYDANPLIAVIAASSCSTVTDESFVLPLSKPSTTNMLAAGFTDSAYQHCLLNESADYAAWKLTRVEETFNPYHLIGGGQVTPDTTVTLQAMQQCRAAFGQRCILSNHGWGATKGTEQATVYTAMHNLGTPISLQLYSPYILRQDSQMGSGVLQNAISLGAGSVELWTTEFTTFSQTTVQGWAHLFPAT